MSDKKASRYRSSFGFVSGFFSFSFILLLLSPVFIYLEKADWQLVVFVLVTGLLAAIESMVDAYVFSADKIESPVSIKISTLFILMILLWFFSSLIEIDSFPHKLLPGLLNISSVIVLLGSAIFSRRLRAILVDRKKIHEIIRQAQDKDDSEAFISNASDLAGSWRETRGIKTWSMVLFVIALVIAAATFFAGVFSWYIGLCFICALISSLLLVSVANSFEEENRYYEHGLSSPQEIQDKRQNISFFQVLTCVFLGFIVANAWSLFDYTVIRDIFVWIMKQFIPSGQVVDNSEKLSNHLSELYEARKLDMSMLAPAGQSNQWLGFIFKVVQIAGAILVALLALNFLLKPFLRKSNGKFLSYLGDTLKQLFGVVLKPIMGIGAFFWSILFNRKRRTASASDLSKKDIKPLEYLLNLSSGTRAETAQYIELHKKSLRIYLRYLEWGFRQGLRWDLSHTPSEIAARSVLFFSKPEHSAVLKSIDRFKSAIHQLSGLLEEDLYSDKPLDKEQLKTMEELVSVLTEKHG